MEMLARKIVETAQAVSMRLGYTAEQTALYT
jgi:hypothetical protein